MEIEKNPKIHMYSQTQIAKAVQGKDKTRCITFPDLKLHLQRYSNQNGMVQA